MVMLGNREHQIDTGRAEAAIVGARFVKQGTAMKGIVQGTAGALCLGIAPFDIASGVVGSVIESGSERLEVEVAIAIGDKIACGTAGKGKVAAAGDVVQGVAESAAAADGDFITVNMTPSKVIL